MTADDGKQLLAWCVVANVATQTQHGPGGQDIQRGLKHFSVGAKVWVLPVQWGDGGDNIFVVGRHRGAARRGYIRIVIGRRHLTNFRVRGIYAPSIIQAATAPWRSWPEGPSMWRSRDEAEQAAHWWRSVDSRHP